MVAVISDARSPTGRTADIFIVIFSKRDVKQTYTPPASLPSSLSFFLIKYQPILIVTIHLFIYLKLSAMVKTLTKEIVNGTLKVVQNIRYSNGRTVKRVLNPKTGVPTQLIVVKE